MPSPVLPVEIQPSALVLLFLLSAYGWGRLARPWLDRRVLRFHSLTAILGLAVLNLIGGVLNLAHLARPPLLLALLLIGLAGAARDLLRRRPWRRIRFSTASLPLLVALGAALGAAGLLLPSEVFNHGDDFHTYTPRVVRMLQTGSLAGNAFDHFGLDSLGSQSFFHGFFMAGDSIRLLNGFDAVACFALCLLLVGELALRWRLPWWFGVSAVLGAVWFNPQFVNVSPVYSGAAGVMGLAVCGALLARAVSGTSDRPVWRLALAVGLLAAWLATLKLSFAFFAGIFLATLFVALSLRAGRRRAVWWTAGLTAGTTCAAALPWVLLPLPALWQARVVGEQFAAHAALADKFPSLACHELPRLFALGRLFYGNTTAVFLAIAGASFALGLAGLAHWWKSRCERRSSGLTAVAAAGVAMFATLLLNCDLFTIGSAVRFSCPLLLGGLMVALAGWLRFRTRAGTPARGFASLGATAALLVLLATFHPQLLKRFHTAVQARTLLVYPFNGSYLEHSHRMLGAEEAAYHASVQTHAPPGSTVLVWSAAPMLFDYRRNELFVVCVGGLINPAIKFPAGLPTEELREYFLENGIQYVLVEVQGYGVAKLSELEPFTKYPPVFYRKFGEYGIYLRRAMEELAASSTVRFSDGRFVLFEVASPKPAPRTHAAPAWTGAGTGAEAP